MKQALPQCLDLRLLVGGGGAGSGRGVQPTPSVESIPAHSPSLSLSWQLPTGCPGDRLSLPGWTSVGLTSRADGCRLTINFLPEASYLQLSGQEMTFWLVFHTWVPLFIK